MNFTILVICAIVGGFIFQKLKIPGGMMVGSALACALANILLNLGGSLPIVKTIAQVLSGIYIGINVESEELRGIKGIIKPLLIVMVGLFITNIITGFLIYFISPFSLITSLLAVTPGGVNNIPLIAADMGADPALVAIFQSARMIIGVGIFPSLIKRLADKRPKDNILVTNASKAPSTKKTKVSGKQYLQLLVISLLAYLCGWLGVKTKLPSAYLVFPILFCITLKALNFGPPAPKSLRAAAQLLTGIYIGTCIGAKDIQELPYIIIPLIIMISLFVLTFLITGWIIYKKHYFDYTEALLASSPAGASDMALITADLGIQNTNLNLMQVARLLLVVLLFPVIIQWLLHFVPWQ